VPVTKKPLEVRMGSGKGKRRVLGRQGQARQGAVRDGRVTEEIAREAFRLAGAKLSVSTTFVKRQVR